MALLAPSYLIVGAPKPVGEETQILILNKIALRRPGVVPTGMKEKSDQDLHYLPFHILSYLICLFDLILYVPSTIFQL